jgi:cytoskeletal protein RodZ
MTETIGQRLKKAREYRNLTLEKVEEATHIRVQFLRALEADDFSAMPSPVQARGFLRNYAQYLDLDLDQMVEELRAARPEPEVEAEVIFEGEKTVSIPEPETPEPEVEADEAQAESSAEPFWQTWLKRVKREVGDMDEEPASQLDPESATVLGPDVTPEADAGLGAGQEATGEDAEDESEKKTKISFLEWANIRFSRKDEEAPLETESEDEQPGPDLELESEPEPQPGEIPPEPGLSSQEIFNEIGLQLRMRREMLSLTLGEIERHTRMRAQFMEALEKGDIDELPSPVQTRGMLTNYASFLDLDVDALLLRFADALQARRRERHPEATARKREQPDIPESLPPLRRYIAGDLVFGIGMVLLLIAFSVWGISRVIALQSEQEAEVQVEEEGPSISEALIGTPVENVTPEVTLIPVEDTPIPGLPGGTFEIPTQAANVNVQVNIVAIERAYLHVVVDGEEAFNGRTIPGNVYPFDAEQSVEVLTGNGAALRVIYNQRDMGLLGGFGQIASFIYTIDEVLVPTPEVPPTATLTPFVSPTPSVTPTATVGITGTP